MSLGALLAQLDPDPGKRGSESERICRWYLTNAPEYRGCFRRIWLWKEWPDAWGGDAGITWSPKRMTAICGPHRGSHALVKCHRGLRHRVR